MSNGASSEPFDVAAIVDQQLATRPGAPKPTDGERAAVVSALEGAAEATVPVIKKLVAERDRLREELERVTSDRDSLLIEYRSAAQLLREREGEDWLRGADETFGLRLRRLLHEGEVDADQ